MGQVHPDSLMAPEVRMAQRVAGNAHLFKFEIHEVGSFTYLSI